MIRKKRGAKGVVGIRISKRNTTQWPKEKGQNDETIYKAYTKLKIE